jgi:uncharacterized protein (TIGR03086 family)
VTEHSNAAAPAFPPPLLVDQLARAFDAVGVLVSHVKADQWSDPTPCPEWDVRRLLDHVIGLNRIFTALLLDAPPPLRATTDHAEEHPTVAYRETSAALLSAFGQPGVLDRQFRGPLGTASGADRLQIRLYDLLAHGWDLSRATGQPVDLPDDLVEPSLLFARAQLAEQRREGRFAPAQSINRNAAAIERLAAFLGRAGAGS